MVRQRQSTVSGTASSYTNYMLISLNSLNQLRLARFMQDGAPPHTEDETIDLLHQLFGNVISLGKMLSRCPTAWI